MCCKSSVSLELCSSSVAESKPLKMSKIPLFCYNKLLWAIFSQPKRIEGPDLNSMCTNVSTCLVVKMKFISQMVLECGRIL